MTELLRKIRTRGNWEVVIRPNTFVADRVADISELASIIETNVVRSRGWEFPHIDSRSSITFGRDFISQESEWQHHKGFWRLYQSGQFFYAVSLAIDWRDESTVWPADADWHHGQLLGVGETIFQFAELFAFASRLGVSKAGDRYMHVGVVLRGLRDRQLYIDSSRNRWPFHYAHKASISEFPIAIDKSQTELVAHHTDLGLDSAKELFKRFGWNPSRDELADWLEKRG